MSYIDIITKVICEGNVVEKMSKILITKGNIDKLCQNYKLPK